MICLVSREDYIAHHGIKGQKWGVRRFQNEDGSLTPAGKERRRSNSQSEGYIPMGAVTAGLYAATLLTAVSAAAVRKGAAKAREAKAAQRLIDSKVDPKTGVPLKSEPTTEDQDMRLANPGRGNGKRETQFNCTFCSTAYDLRRRGFEVTARQTDRPMTSDDYKKFYKGANTVSIEPIGHEKIVETIKRSPWLANNKMRDFRRYHKEMKAQITKELLSQGNGARGYFGVTWLGSPGGHSMVYEVSDGKVIVRDCQIGKKVSFSKILDNSSLCRYTRIDDKEPDYDELRKAGVI